MIFQLSIDNNGNLVLKSETITIIVPRHKLNRLSQLYNEVYPFINLSFEWIYETFNLYSDYELLLKNDFLNLFIEKIKNESDIQVIEKEV